MDALKELDKIAYIRFASVYTNFKEVGEFGECIEELDGKSKNNFKSKNLHFLYLAFEQAKINLGSTKTNHFCWMYYREGRCCYIIRLHIIEWETTCGI